jgi:L-threonylcarbamoyladenylate synthase
VTASLISASALDAIDSAAAALEGGALIGIPTETVYGVCALPLHESVELLITAKQRSSEKGIQLLVDSLEQVRSVAIVTRAAEQLAERFWPGGLTIVLDRLPDIDLTPLLGGGRPTLGLRLPDHAVPRALARRLGPIAASSANVSGQPDATDATLVARSLGDVLALIIDDGPVRGGTPSTVVDCSDDSVPPRILREGAISADDIAAALRYRAKLARP